MRGPRAVVLVVLALGLSGASAAGADAVVTVGQTAPVATQGFCFVLEPIDLVGVSVASGSSYTVPAPGGVITSWSTLGALDEGETQELSFGVFRQVGYDTYAKVFADGPRTLTPGVLNTFPVQAPVRGGDVIGLGIPSLIESGITECQFGTEMATDELGFIDPSLAVGASGEAGSTESNARLNLSATLVPPPTIASLSPASGSITGSAVTIGGSNFVKVSGVSFGGAPASSFTVDSEGQITAKAPPVKKPAEVPVTVTTFAGSTAVPATFTYTACRVPKLRDKTLKAAQKSAKAAGCKLGKVTKKKSVTGGAGKVAGQKPKPGTLTAPGTKIKVSLGP